MERVGKGQYYLAIAATVAGRSTCLRRQYGAVIVKNDEIIATGYNGAARGEKNCCDVGQCWREAHGIPHGKQYERCVAVHAEANAIISASRQELLGSTLYLAGLENGEPIAGEPCFMCARTIRNAGIAKVININGEVSLERILEKSREIEDAVEDPDKVRGEESSERFISSLCSHVAFFDLDGTLGEMRFADNKCLEYPEDPNRNYYETIRPIYTMQNIVKRLDPERVFVLSHVSGEKEAGQKRVWLAKYYPTILPENILFSSGQSAGAQKAKIICDWCAGHKLPASCAVLVEDDINNIEQVENSKTGISCLHISSLIV